MENINHLDLLAIIIALAAYIGVIRLAALDRMKKRKRENTKQENANTEENEYKKDNKVIKLFLLFLIPADFFLIVAGYFTFLRIFGENWCITIDRECLDKRIVIFFLLALMVLVGHHLFFWGRTIYLIFFKKDES